MDLNNIATLISAVGFPIVACIGMGLFFARIIENYRNDIKEIQAIHKEEVTNMTQAINNNTLVIQKLVDSMNDMEG